MSVGRRFLERSRTYLQDEYRVKIHRCLDRLQPDQVWWRPNEASNSIGNLILHLCGNARQWIVSGVGEIPDTRRRDEEFAARKPIPTDTLRRRLDEAIEDVTEVLSALDPTRLDEPRTIQGYEVTVFEAVYHVVEHFSMHTGQIGYITKLLTGEDLRFYVGEDGLAMPNW